MAIEAGAGADPGRDCPFCPRLKAFREENRRRYPDFDNAPISPWGDPEARLAIVGLAPGLKGANRTGRPFTGDYAGDLLFATLKRFGLAAGAYEKHEDDGLHLVDAVIVNAVRCVPPQNKPTPAEINTCRQFLVRELRRRPRARTFLVLGRIAHDSLLRVFGEKLSAHPFAHGAEHLLPDGVRVFDSYHCSRYNTNTGVLTAGMFEDVVGRAAAAIRDQS